MSTFIIGVVTRNRLEALIDALFSIKRIRNDFKENSLRVLIQDNSDDYINKSVLSYFERYLDIDYVKTNDTLSMSQNWDSAILHCYEQGADYISILADRRLVSRNIVNALEYTKAKGLPFMCFDHQDVWLNSSAMTTAGHSYSFFQRSYSQLLCNVSSASISWRQPMLFNCVISAPFLYFLKSKYNSFASGQSPDMDFLARVVDSTSESYWIFDAPCIITNARHVNTSNGMNLTKSPNINNTEHIHLSGLDVYPEYMIRFVSANILGSLARYWPPEKVRSFIDQSLFFNSCLLELSYPNTVAAFLDMRKSLLTFIEDFSLGTSFLQRLSDVEHVDIGRQRFPIDTSTSITNCPNLDLLSQIEHG